MDQKEKTLHSRLVDVLGSRNVYFQTPTKLSYPCIKVTLSRRDSQFADNKRYVNRKKYTLTIIDTIGDSLLPDKIEALPFVAFDRTYVSDGLYHFVYTITI